MTYNELLTVAEAVLRDAIEEAEFTRKPKDIAYAQDVAQKTEKLRAKVDGRPPMEVRMYLENGRVYVQYTSITLGFPYPASQVGS